jgi:hypothetical protein
MMMADTPTSAGLSWRARRATRLCESLSMAMTALESSS